MNLSSSLPALVALVQVQAASSTECGKWFSSACVCETDIKYCQDGDNGASDDIVDQHPFWKHYIGLYEYTIHTFIFGLYPAAADEYNQFLGFPSTGYMNQTIEGSRTYNHRYQQAAPNPAVNCSSPLTLPFPGFDGECGVNGVAIFLEGFGTGTPERDGTVVTTTALQPQSGDPNQAITDEDAEYKQVPIDENTLFGSAKSDMFLVTETFSFTNTERTKASAVQDVFMTVNGTTTLVSSSRMTFKKLDNVKSFEDGIISKYEEYNVIDIDQVAVPMTKMCLSDECPTDEDFCKIDPRCTVSVKYQEPAASVKAGPIVGIVAAAFVVLIGILFLWHRKLMKVQAERNQAIFARRIAETIKLEGPDRELTPEALAEEFKKIDNGNVDGAIDKKELWEFINSGNVVKMNESDFNALFSALDIDGDGQVNFMEFSAYMGKCYGEFDTLKQSASVKESRGAKMDNYYSGVSRRILSIPNDSDNKNIDVDVANENV